MFSKNSDGIYVICDVGSATVSAGLVIAKSGKKPKVIYSVRVPISINNPPNNEALEKDMLSLLKNAVSQVAHDGFMALHKQGYNRDRVNEVIVTFASPWYVSRSKNLVIHQREPFRLTHRLIDQKIEVEEKSFEDDAVSGKFNFISGKDIRMIEREIASVRLNGYSTSTIFDKTASYAEMSLYMSLIPESIIDAVEKFTEDLLHTDNIRFHTFPLVFFKTVDLLYHYESDYLLVDLAGESTDISLVRDGVLGDSVSIELGRNGILRDIMEGLKVNQEIAYSFLNLNEDNFASEASSQELKTIIGQSVEKWKDAFSKALSQLNGGNNMPGLCFVISDNEFMDVYNNAISGLPALGAGARVVMIGDNQLAKFVDFSANIKNDKFIALEASYVSTQASR